MPNTILSKQSLIPALYFKVINSGTDGETYTDYMVALCPGYFGHFLKSPGRIHNPPMSNIMVFYGYATDPLDTSTIVPYTLDTPNNALIGNYIVVKDGGDSGPIEIKKFFKFVSAMRRKTNPEKYGIVEQAPEPSPFDVISRVKLSLFSNFKDSPEIGSQIECIRATGSGKHGGVRDRLTLGKVYTVLGVELEWWNTEERKDPLYWITIKDDMGDEEHWLDTRFKPVKSEPSPFDVISRVRLSHRTNEFKTGDTIRYVGGQENLRYYEMFPADVLKDLLAGETYKVQPIAEDSISPMVPFIGRANYYNTSGGRGGISDYWWLNIEHIEKVEPGTEPSPFDVISRTRLSQHRFKVGEAVRTVPGYGVDDKNPYQGIVRHVGKLYRGGEEDEVWSDWNQGPVKKDWDGNLTPNSAGGNLTKIQEKWLELIPGYAPEPSPFDVISRVRLSQDNDKEKHFITRTNKHIALVGKAIDKIVTYPEEEFREFDVNELDTRKELHDASKFEEPEKTPYIFITDKYKCKSLGVPFECPEGMDDKMNEATLHHVTNNPHHPEYHLKDKSDANISKGDRDKSDKVVDASKMPSLDVAEMVADWVAMSEELGTNSARDWFDKCKDVRWHFSEEQCNLIDRLLKVFEDKEVRLSQLYHNRPDFKVGDEVQFNGVSGTEHLEAVVRHIGVLNHVGFNDSVWGVWREKLTKRWNGILKALDVDGGQLQYCSAQSISHMKEPEPSPFDIISRVKLSQNNNTTLKLYHASYLQNKEDILTEGLNPNKRAHNWSDWSEDGYVYLAQTEKRAVQWMQDLYDEHPEAEVDDIVVFGVTVTRDKLVNDVGDNFKYEGIITPDMLMVVSEYEYIPDNKGKFGFKRIGQITPKFKVGDYLETTDNYGVHWEGIVRIVGALPDQVWIHHEPIYWAVWEHTLDTEWDGDVETLTWSGERGLKYMPRHNIPEPSPFDIISKVRLSQHKEVENNVVYPFTGKAYRYHTGFTTSEYSAGDIIRFNSDELGNVEETEHLTPVQLKELDSRPGDDLVWVTKDKKDAAQYALENLSNPITERELGLVEEYPIPEGSVVLAEDGSGGCLVLLGGFKGEGIKLSRHVKSLLESKLPMLVKRYPDLKPEEAQERIRMLNQADPTGEYGEYTPWIVRLDVNKTSRFPEDIEKIKETLKEYIEIKKKPNDVIFKDIVTKIQTDIFKYATYSDLVTVLEPYEEVQQRFRPSEYAEDNDLSVEEVIYQDATYKILRLTDARIVSKLCKGTNWCVKDVYTANDYLDSGSLVLVYKNNKRYVLIHSTEERSDYNYESGEWAGEFKDRFDREATKELYDELNPLIHNEIPSKYHLMFSKLSPQEIDWELDSNNVENDLLYRHQTLSTEQIDYAIKRILDNDDYNQALYSLVSNQKLTPEQIDYLLDSMDDTSFSEPLYKQHQLSVEQIDKALDIRVDINYLLENQKNVTSNHVDRVVEMLEKNEFGGYEGNSILFELEHLSGHSQIVSENNRKRINKIREEANVKKYKVDTEFHP